MAVAPVADLTGLSAAPADLWPALREAFRAARFLDGVLDEAEAIAPGQHEHLRVPLARWGLLRLGRPDATLAALLVYGATVGRARVEEALGAPLCARLLDAGLLRADGERLASAFRVTPFDGVWILSDELWRGGEAVMGPSMTTDTLRRALPALEGRSLLDVGCGAGSLAVWAASKGARAVAADLAPRAIEMTRLNALLNDVPCELATGDLTRPVAGRTFDLVVSQPPFLIKPPDVDAVTFLHGGNDGLELVYRLLSEVEGVLAEGGRALVLFAAGVGATPIAQRVLGAVKPRRPVGLVVSIGGYLSADQVASSTAATSHAQVDAAYAATVARYREHLAALGIDRVAHVVADLRRLPPGAASFAATFSWNLLAALRAPLLDQAWRAVELVGRGPETLLAAPLRVAEGARLRVEQPLDGDQQTFTLTFPGGAIQDQTVDGQTVAVLQALGARGTVAGACEELAEPGQAAELHAPVLDLVRNLLLHGVLVV
jgi:SAM-dependent methyltransferase